MIDLAKETTRQISEWFAENPAVTSEDDARKIKLYIDRAKLCLKNLEDDRDRKVRPLNERVAQINADHRAVRKPLGVVLDMMLEASDVYLRAEEERRLALADEAARVARELEERARRAEEIERDKLDDARMGEVGVDIAAVTEQADAAFEEYARAERAAIRALEDTHVKIAGGFTRAIGFKEREVLHIDDLAAAIQDMAADRPGIEVGWSLPESLTLAILTAARAFRRTFKRLPNGIRATTERRAR